MMLVTVFLLDLDLLLENYPQFLWTKRYFLQTKARLKWLVARCLFFEQKAEPLL